MVEPAFLALTSTPSIAPSSAEVTCPVSAAGACARAGKDPACNSAIARPADVRRYLMRVVPSQSECGPEQSRADSLVPARAFDSESSGDSIGSARHLACFAHLTRSVLDPSIA